MNTGKILLALTLSLLTSVLQAQAACPRLDANTSIHWEEKQVPDLTFCRALDASGNELFSLSLAHDYPFKPSRSQRAESAVINGRSTYWYRTEIATRPGVEARETLVKLNDGRVAYFNVQANTIDALPPVFDIISRLSF